MNRLLIFTLLLVICVLAASACMPRSTTVRVPASATPAKMPQSVRQALAANGARLFTTETSQELLAASLWHLDGPNERFVSSWSPNGMLSLTERTSGQLVDVGRWWTESDRFCRQWQNASNGEAACFYAVFDGTTAQLYELDGTLYRRISFTYTPIEASHPPPTPVSSRILYIEGVKVSTLAGDGHRDYRDGPSAQARFGWPSGVAVDNEGNVYVSEVFGHRVRRIGIDGQVSTLAGTGAAGYADGPGASSQFSTPTGLDVDDEGNLYVADAGNHRIRAIRPNGLVITLAGNGNQGYRDGAAAEAEFNAPTGVAVDSRGFIYVADLGNSRIRVISPEGMVSTMAGSDQWGLKDGPGDQARFYGPYRLDVDAAGHVFVVDGLWMLKTGNHAIRRVSPSGVVSTVAGNGRPGFADGAASDAGLSWPGDVAVDRQGNLYVADSANHRIRVITPQGTAYTLAGNGTMGLADGSGPEAEFFWPDGIAWDGADRLFVTDYFGQRVRVLQLPDTLMAAPPVTPSDPYAGQNVIRIGFVEEHQAPANIVAAAKLGAQLAVDEANAAGGVQVGETRYDFALVTAADWYEPPDTNSQAAAHRLLDQGVVAVVGHIASEASMLAAQVYGPAGVVMVSPVSSDPRLTEAGWWTVYRVTSNDEYMAAVAARMTIQELGLRRAVLLGESATHVQVVMDAWHNAFESLGGQVVGRINADVESASAVTGELRSLAPEVVVLFPTRARSPSDFVALVLASDVDALIIGVESMSDAPDFLGRAGQDAEGVYDAVTGRPREIMDGYEGFARRYRKADIPILPDPDDYLVKWAPFGYDATNVIIAAIRRAAEMGQITRQSVAVAVNGFRNEAYPGITGPIQFDEFGDLLDQSVYFKKVVDGQWVDVLPGGP